MKVFIPTINRVGKQETLQSLMKTDITPVLVCPEAEAEAHRHLEDVIFMPHPSHIKGIGAVRQWIMENVDEPAVVMLDDDLTFASRREDNPTLFRPATPAEITIGLEDAASLAAEHGHSAIAAREGANRRTERIIEHTRMLRALAYGRKQFFESKARFTDMEVMEDFHVALHLLTRGHRALVVNWLVQNQRGSGAAGGCSTYRSLETQNRAAHALADKYPAFVRTVEKTTKTAWGGATRTDVIVQWKRAWESSNALW